MIRREIESTDKAIDALVFELYGLTKEEIAIVVGGWTYCSLPKDLN
jgi:hypothetical protein